MPTNENLKIVQNDENKYFCFILSLENYEVAPLLQSILIQMVCIAVYIIHDVKLCQTGHSVKGVVRFEKIRILSSMFGNPRVVSFDDNSSCLKVIITTRLLTPRYVQSCFQCWCGSCKDQATSFLSHGLNRYGFLLFL